MNIVKYADDKIYGVDDFEELFTRVKEYVNERRNDAYHEKVKLNYILQLITELFTSVHGFITVADSPTRLALQYGTVVDDIIIKEGLVVLQNDTQELYVLIGNDPSIESSWKLLMTIDVGIIPIRTLSNLPAPVNGVITLTTSGKLYYFVNEVDFEGNVFYPKNNSFYSSSQNSGAIFNASEIVLDSDTTFRYMKFRETTIRFTSGAESYDWAYINFFDCTTSLRIQNADNIILDTVGFLNSSGVIVEGTLSSLVLSPNCFFSPYTLGTGTSYIDITSTAVINRRIRIENSAFVVSTNNTGITIHPSATINPETFILNTVNFAGEGTYFNGVNGDSDIARFTNCSGTGVINSTAIGGLILQTNVTSTPVVQNVPTKILGSFTGSSLDQRFNVINGVSYYTSSITRTFKVICSYTFTASNNTVIGTYIAKVASGNVVNTPTDIIPESEMYTTANGTRPDSGTIVTFITLSQGDGWYIATENTTGNNAPTYSFIHGLIETTN